MGATFSRVKNWTTEVLSNTDLNAEIDNILNNLDPSGVDDYSATATQMKLNTNPGTTGSESLATSLAGEIERLRYVIKRIVGTQITNWYDAPTTSLTDLLATIGTQTFGNRIISGRTTGNSSQLCALIPTGTTASSVVISASVTPLIYAIANQNYTISTNVTVSGLSLAPSSNNTAAVNATDGAVAVAGQQWTRVWGQFGTKIPIDGAGSQFASGIGTLAGFKTANSEYFLAYINSTTELTNAWRGCMFNTTPTAVRAAGLSDNDSITILKTAWLFVNTSGSMAVTYANPSVSGSQPTSPNTGDYWYDMSTTAWKTYNSTTWVNASATMLGFSFQDTVGCVAARTLDAYAAYSDLNTMRINSTVANTQVQAAEMFSEVQVFGTKLSYNVTRPTWDTSLHLDAGSFSPSTNYYMYLKESGVPVLSQHAPQYRRDLQGLYYQGETWRCLGSLQSNSSTQFTTPVKNFNGDAQGDFRSIMLGDNSNIYGTASYTAQSFANNQTDAFSPNMLTSTGVNFTLSLGGQLQDAGTISLTPGVWRLSAAGALSVLAGTASGVATWSFGISTASGNAFNDSATLVNCCENIFEASTATYRQSGSIPEYIVRTNAPTSFFFKSYISTLNTVSTVAMRGRLTATRLNELFGMP